ncbi:GIY-YIG nuclease family protein [Candidatus Spongiihabitans sp.]|uniref:GIY-YIG nuclease family protein n=1 Tax=Candidatus Spongiihabitans sp. TaxID=3101308 RepID=UPI003C7B229A
MREKHPYVYIMASRRNGTLYVGVTSDLPARVWQHKNNSSEGFTKKHQVHKLVYFEEHGEMLLAIEREKRMKKWHRKTKLALIEKHNPEWMDLYEDIVG